MEPTATRVKIGSPALITVTELFLAVDDQRVEGREKGMLLEYGLLIGELGSGIRDLRLCDLDVALRYQQLGLGDILVALRLFGRLCRRGLAGDQFLPALVDLQPLREDGAGLCSVGIGLLHGHFGAQHGGLRPRHLRLLLGGVEPARAPALSSPRHRDRR